MSGMTLDFNNLRINAANAYNDLVTVLNRERNERGLVKVYEEDLEEPLRDLRRMIGMIMCVYDDSDNPEFRCVVDDVEMITFAPDADKE